MMKCSECKSKIIEYIDGTLSEDLDYEIKQHLLECENCKTYYEEEILIDKAFNEEFNLDNMNFNSSKNKIMASIDKDKYIKGGIKIMKRKNNFGKGIAIAAVFFLLGFLTPMATKYFGTSGDKNASLMEAKQSADITKENANKSEEVQSKTSDNVAGVADSAKSATRESVDNYDMTKVSIDTKLEFNSGWKTAKNLEATLEGKGNNNQEEGIGTIYIKDKQNNTMYKYTIKNNGKQSSPLSINWYDDESLIVVNGLGYGTLINGVEAQLINVKTGDEFALYKVQENNERIKSVVREGSQLKITKAMYDEDMNNYKEQVDTKNITE